MLHETIRYGYWARYTYPENTGVGQSSPYQSVVAYIPEWGCLLIPNGVGDVYLQPLPDTLFAYAYVEVKPKSDAGLNGTGLIPIVSTLKTMLSCPGNDPTMTYRMFGGTVYGGGLYPTLSIDLFRGFSQGFSGDEIARNNTVNTSEQVVPVLSRTTALPFQWIISGLDGSDNSPCVEFNLNQITLTGQNLIIVKMDYQYAPVRKSFVNYD
jgi:hypothetical protein